jgi:tetratricopeptide (TPR) repeat protein
MPSQTASRAQFEEIIELINEGQAEQARQLCHTALQQFPRDVTMLGLMGAICMKTNDNKEAERYLRETLKLAPSFAKPHEDLGILLVNLGRNEEAVPILEKAARLDPKNPGILFNLGKALAKQGKGKEADEIFEAAFELAPERKMLADAARLHGEGKYEEAERIYREILSTSPGNVDALRMLAMIAATAGNFDDAERLLRKTLKLAPDFFTAHVDLGRILKEQDRYEEAISSFRAALNIEPNNANAWFMLGATLAPAALTWEAVAAYEKSLELRADAPAVLLGLGHVLKTVGEQERGIAAYKRCIELKPDNGETYWSLANLKTFRFSDTELAQMEERIRSGEINHESSEVNFHFALGKAYEDREDFDTAWRWYESGNNKQRGLVSYDPVETQFANDALIEVFDAGFMARMAGVGCGDPAPIFILGLPRSGSTLIEQILASHSMVEGTSELPYLGRVSASLNRNRADGVNYPQAVRELEGEHLQALGEDYLNYASLHRTEGKPRFIDKMPNNFPNIGFLHLILPNAKIIDARRHPLDSCLGNYRQLYAKGQTFTYDQTDIGEYFLQYQRLMDYWHELLPGKILTVQYEENVTDLENQVRRMLEFCELPWEDACLRYYETDRPVRTASSEQVRQPIYFDSINFWRHYEDKLGELIEVLEPVRDRYRQYENINATIQKGQTSSP